MWNDWNQDNGAGDSISTGMRTGKGDKWEGRAAGGGVGEKKTKSFLIAVLKWAE